MSGAFCTALRKASSSHTPSMLRTRFLIENLDQWDKWESRITPISLIWLIFYFNSRTKMVGFGEFVAKKFAESKKITTFALLLARNAVVAQW